MARNRAHRFLDSFTQSCGLPANLFAVESNVMGGSDSDLAVLFEPIVLGVCLLRSIRMVCLVNRLCSMLIVMRCYKQFNPKPKGDAVKKKLYMQFLNEISNLKKE
nr:hypothetical protein Iba_chr02bCG11600 [Ipomoea batatas]